MFDEEERNHPTVAADECRLWKILMNKYLMQLKNDKRKQKTQKVKLENNPNPTPGSRQARGGRRGGARGGKGGREGEGLRLDLSKIPTSSNGNALKKEEENMYPPNLHITSQEDIEALVAQGLLSLPAGFSMPLQLAYLQGEAGGEAKLEHPLPPLSD